MLLIYYTLKSKGSSSIEYIIIIKEFVFLIKNVHRIFEKYSIQINSIYYYLKYLKLNKHSKNIYTYIYKEFRTLDTIVQNIILYHASNVEVQVYTFC